MRKKDSRTAMPEPSRGAVPAVPTPTNIHDLPDDLLELVLLRACSSVCLVRAAAACKLWRRVIAGAGFLHRYGLRLHPPQVLGHYYDNDDPSVPFFVPSPVSPGEAAVDLRGRVSLNFLSRHCCYPGALELSDGGCGSLLAFVKISSTVVVCNPWTRQQRELRPPSPWEGNGGRYHSCIFGAFLLIDEDDTSIDMSCFRLLCVSLIRDHNTGTKTAWATMFSARDGGCWITLGSRDVGAIMPSPSCWISARKEFLGRAGGSLCWSGEAVSNAVLRLDESSGEFSTFTLPPDARRNHWSSYYNREKLRIVGGGGGSSVRLARILDDDLEVLRWSRDGGEECVVERKVCLSPLAGIELIKLEWPWRFLDTAETATQGNVVLLPYEGCMLMFSVNVETMVLTRSHKRNWQAHRVFPYELSWPRTIMVCV